MSSNGFWRFPGWGNGEKAYARKTPRATLGSLGFSSVSSNVNGWEQWVRLASPTRNAIYVLGGI